MLSIKNFIFFIFLFTSIMKMHGQTYVSDFKKISDCYYRNDKQVSYEIKIKYFNLLDNDLLILTNNNCLYHIKIKDTSKNEFIDNYEEIIIMANVKKIYGDKISYFQDEYAVLEGADSLIIATEWALFRTPDFEKLKVLTTRSIFDGRNLYDVADMKDKGFYYSSIGREVVLGRKPVNA